MARGAYNATTAATAAVASVNYTMATIYNASDTTVYVQWTAEGDELTAANGYPIPTLSTLRIVAANSGPQPPIKVIHGGSGNKSINYVLQ